MTPVIKRVSLRFPWSVLPEKLWPVPLHAYCEKGDQLTPPWPDVIISSGRAAAPGCAALKEKLARRGKAPFLMHVMDPRMDLGKFDLVVAPQHDGLEGANVLPVLGTLHGVSDEKLAQLALPETFPFQCIDRPKVAVFVGGESRHFSFGVGVQEKLIQDLKALVRRGMCLMISPSRRTPEGLVQALGDQFSKEHYVWTGAGENPYWAMLTAADGFLVTGDSVSMLSEMAALSRNLFIYALPLKKKTRLSGFADALVAGGYAAFYAEEGFDLALGQKQLQELDRILPEVRKRLEKVSEF